MTVRNRSRFVVLSERGLAIFEGKAAGVPQVSGTRRSPVWLPDGTEAITTEQKAVTLGNFEQLELKVVRHVRTAAGVRKYGQPIGSIIVADGNPLTNLKDTGESEYYGWSKAKGSDGVDYYIGKDETTGAWVATGGDDWDNLVVDGAKSEEEALRLLDHAVNTHHKSRKKSAAPIRGAKHENGPGKEHADVIGGQVRQADNKPATSKASAPKENHGGEAAGMSDAELTAAIKKERSQTSARALALNNEQVRRNNRKIKRTDLSNRERNDYESLGKDGKVTYIQSRNEGQNHAVAMSQASRNSSYLEEDKPVKKPAEIPTAMSVADLNAIAGGTPTSHINNLGHKPVTKASLDVAKPGDKVTISVPGKEGINHNILTMGSDGRWHKGTRDEKGSTSAELLKAYARVQKSHSASIRFGDAPGPFSGGRTLPGGSKK